MKKIIAVILTTLMVLLVLCLIFCGKSDAGYYVLTRIENDDGAYGEVILSMVNADKCFIQLNKDGTGIADFGHIGVFDLTWEHGEITLNDDGVSTPYELKDDTLSIRGDEWDATFTRQDKK